MFLKDRTSRAEPLFQTDTVGLLAQEMIDGLMAVYLTIVYRFAPVGMLPYSDFLGSQAVCIAIG